MENIIRIVQWTIFLLVLLINFLVGYKRGFKKSLFYTLSSLILSIVLLFGLSFISIRIVFKTPGALLSFTDKFFSLPESVRVYLVNPELSPYVFAILDLVLRIVLLLILYPLVKFLITLIVSRPIWNKIRRSNDSGLNISRKPSFESRLSGGMFGIIRGVIVVFILFLPIIVFSGAVNSFQVEDGTNERNVLRMIFKTSSGDEEEKSDIDAILDGLQAFTNEGIGLFSKRVKFGEKSVDEIVFDSLFSTTIKTKDGEKVDLKFAEELNLLGGVAQILYENGYIDKSFNFEDINHQDDYKNIDQILTNLGDSTLINLLLPIGIDVLDQNEFFDKLLKFDVSENIYTKESFEQLKLLSWQKEMSTISKLINELLLIDDVRGLMAISNNPKDILNYEFETQQRISKAIDLISKLDSTVGINIAVEYMLKQESIQKKITWNDNPYEYLHERLEFIFSNPKYFKGEDGAIKDIAQLSEVIFSEENQDYDFTKFFAEGKFDPKILLEEDTSKIINDVLGELSGFELAMKSIPLGVDLFVYTNSFTAGDTADQISGSLDGVDFGNEITNVKDIYQKLFMLGLEPYFEDEAQVIAVTDSLLSNPETFTSLKEIINLLFEDSNFINEVLEIVSVPLVEKLVKDEEIKDISLKVLSSEDFKIGKELSNILQVLEYGYKITNIEGAVDLIQNKEYIALLTKLEQLDLEEFNTFKSRILSLQTIKSAGTDILLFAKDKAKLDDIFIPETITYESLSRDLNKVFDLTYNLALSAKEKGFTDTNYKDFNLASLLDYENLRTILNFDPLLDKDSILLYTAAHNIKNLEINQKIITLPDNLEETPINEEAWILELNNIISGTLNLIEPFKGSNEEFILSINNLTNIKSLNDLPVSLVTRFEDKQLLNKTFSNILSSEIIKSLGLEIAEDALNKSSKLSKLDLLQDGYGSETFSKESLLELIEIAVDVFKEFKTTDTSVGANVDALTTEILIDRFNNMPNALISKISYSKLINNIFRNTLINEGFKELVVDMTKNIKLPSELNGIIEESFKFEDSLDSNLKIKEETLNQILFLAKDLNIPANIKSLEKDALEKYIDNTINENNVRNIFEIDVVNELLRNVTVSDQVYNFGMKYFEKGITSLNNKNFNIYPNYDAYYITIINSLVNSERQLKSIEFEKLASLYQTYVKDIKNDTTLDKTNLTLIAEKLFVSSHSDKNAYQLLSELDLVKGLLGKALNDDEILDFTANLINEATVIGGRKYLNLESSDLRFDSALFDQKGLMENHLYDLLILIATQDLNIIKRGSFDLEDLENLLVVPANTNHTRLNHIYNSKVFESVLKNLSTNDKVNNAMIELLNENANKVSDKLNISGYNFTTNDYSLSWNLLNYEATLSLVNFISDLKISSFKDLSNIKTIEDVKKILEVEDSITQIDNLTSIPLVYYLFESSASNETVKEMITEIINVNVINKFAPSMDPIDSSIFFIDDKYINKTELNNLIIAGFGANIDLDSNFADPRLLNKLTEDVKVAGVNKKAIEQILGSKIIYYGIDSIVRNESIAEFAASKLNSILKNNKIELSLSKEDLRISNKALNNEQKIPVEDFIGIIDTFNSLNLVSYDELTSIKEFGNLKDVIHLGFYDSLFDVGIIHHFISDMSKNDKVLTYAAKEINKLIAKNNFEGKISKDSLLLPEYILDNNKLIPKQELMTIIEGVYGINIDSISNIKLESTFDIQNILPLATANKFLESEIVHYSIDKLAQSGKSRNELARQINKQLEKLNISGKFEGNDFILPVNILDSKSRIKKADLTTMLEAIYMLEIENFKEIKLVGMEDVRRMVPEQVVHTLLEADIFHYSVDKLAQSGKSRNELARQINKQLEKLNISGKFEGNDFILPVNILDSKARITKADLTTMLEAIYMIEIENFKEI
ncbi:CvpA family protein, partial [Haploplasma modicum]|uniref:CvpA family protein n=1 Tax=Haploplasma modicum TaxID=2150 RepID=UPI0012EC9649